MTHGLVVRALIANRVQLPASGDMQLRVGNTSLSIINAQPPHAPTLLDCTRYLDDTTRHDMHSLSGG